LIYKLHSVIYHNPRPFAPAPLSYASVLGSATPVPSFLRSCSPRRRDSFFLPEHFSGLSPASRQYLLYTFYCFVKLLISTVRFQWIRSEVVESAHPSRALRVFLLITHSLYCSSTRASLLWEVSKPPGEKPASTPPRLDLSYVHLLSPPPHPPFLCFPPLLPIFPPSSTPLRGCPELG